MTRFINHIKYLLLISVLAVLMGSCTGLRKLKEGEWLYSGSKIVIDSSRFLADEHASLRELKSVIKPDPNRKFLWMRPALSIHNMVKKTKKEKGFRYWVKYKVGRPPVKLSNIEARRIAAAMVNRLENRGHFDAEVEYEVVKKRKTAKIIFYGHINKPYIIRSVEYPRGGSELLQQISGLKNSSVIQPGKSYNLADFQEEKKRITDFLRNKGYYYFSPDFLVFDADTTLGNRRVDVLLKVKNDIPGKAVNAYTLGQVTVLDDYSLPNYRPDTAYIDNFVYLSEKHQFKPPTILDAIFLRKDSLYSRIKHYSTLKHLLGLGIYKYVNARFTDVDSITDKLNAEILMTPRKKMSLGAEVSAEMNTNNYAGPGVKLSFKNRNIFHGAEMFSVNLRGRFETQIGGDQKGGTNYEISLDASLRIPRFVPIKFRKKTVREYVPTSVITAGGGLFSRVNLYELHTFYTSLGYHWRSNKKISQELKPIDITYTDLAKSSEEFEKYLEENPTIKKSFEEQFVVGTSYNFVYSTLFQRKKPTTFYYSGSLGLAGNLLSLITSATKGSRPTPEDPHKLLNVAYSQFVRLRNEFRFFINMSKRHQIGFRVIAGNGFPFGNSLTLPYVKQFYVGGTNSVRAFRARTVGPGSYNPPDSLYNLYVDQSGDIKLESSIEYRFTIIRFFKGAFFVDAGNIWLASEDENRPGGKFDFKTFYNEFAIGWGLGLRFDFSFLVLRFDFATPMHKPYLPEGQRWVIDKMDFGSKSWRKQNLLFNLAIGYPF